MFSPTTLSPSSLFPAASGMELHRPPGGFSGRLSMLGMWYLKKLNLMNLGRSLLGPGEAIHCPDDIPDDTFYRALLLIKHYAQSPLRDKGLPLQLDFYLALTKAVRMTRGDTLIDFGVYGFPDALKQPRECLYHSMPWVAEERGVPRALPNTTMVCAPHVCTRGMMELYVTFESLVDGKKWAKDAEKFNAFKVELLEEEYGASICTQYLRTLDFGYLDSVMANPHDTLHVFSFRDNLPFSLPTQFAALFLLREYRASPNFYKNALANIDLPSLFYATSFIAMPMFNDETMIPKSRSFFWRMGFPHAQAPKGKTKPVCKHHSILRDLRKPEEEKRVKSGWKKHEWLKMAGELRDQQMQQKGLEVVIAPGAKIGVSARRYMGCDEGVVCTDGMVRLKDYLLAYAFDWNVNVHLNAGSREFMEFREDLEREFGYATMLGRIV